LHCAPRSDTPKRLFELKTAVQPDQKVFGSVDELTAQPDRDSAPESCAGVHRSPPSGTRLAIDAPAENQRFFHIFQAIPCPTLPAKTQFGLP
jgi:hypothetical protein